MVFCRVFIDRPVATTLLALAIFLSGLVALPFLPIATMPDMTATSIMVIANQPGATPQQMATSVSTPLERHLASIADVQTLESSTGSGQTSIFIDFSPSRNIDGALRDVQAALRATMSDLPTGTLNATPQAFKLDGDRPIYLLHLTSKQQSRDQLYDLALIRIRPILAQITGVGRVEIFGASNPAVRVELNPYPLYKWGLNPEDIRSALASANAYTPKGFFTLNGQRIQLQTNDQAINAAQYRNLIVAYRNKFYPIYLRDIARVHDDVQDIYQESTFNGQTAITIAVMPQPHANTVAIVNNITQRLPLLQQAIPATVSIHTGLDLSRTIRASLTDAKLTLIISILLVILVIALFFRHIGSTLIPAITVPVALSGTLTIMAWCGFSLDVLSLMALTIAVGFVIDDAIVVLENIARHMEAGVERYQASLIGTREISFTVISISLSLIAVFIPLLCIPGTLGSIFYEFALTMVAAIILSMVLSLTLTPMLCAHFLTIHHRTSAEPLCKPCSTLLHAPHIWGLYGIRLLLANTEASLHRLTQAYERSIKWSLKHPVLTGLTLPGSLFILIAGVAILPKTALPEMDLAILQGRIVGEPTLSFQALLRRLQQTEAIIQKDPAVQTVVTFNRNSYMGDFFISLKAKSQRDNPQTILARLHKAIPQQAGAEALFWAFGNNRQGGDDTNNTGNYRYVLQSDNSTPLYETTPLLLAKLRASGLFRNLSTNAEDMGSSAHIIVHRDLEARYNVTPQLIQNALFDSYGQSIVSTIHLPLTNHKVVMVVDDPFRQYPNTLHHLWLSTSAGTAAGGIASNLIRVRSKGTLSAQASIAQDSVTNSFANKLSGNNSNGAAVSSSQETMIPLDNVATIAKTPMPLTIAHHNGYYATTLSFDLTDGHSYDEAVTIIKNTLVNLHVSDVIHGEFTGTIGETNALMTNALLAFLAAIAIMYITLGILYESLIHPITILSTLPSAGVGAVLGLWVAGESFSLIAVIGIILLTGIVKKNAILVIDFALQTHRTNPEMTAEQAIQQASIIRFRPILMTTLAAALGGVPLLISDGYGCELRRPLGVAILGGMAISQLLTFYTTPAIYLLMERLKHRCQYLTKKLIARA
ncbi:nodulation protein [Parasaccharibacter apium]|nr:nodulation protein [Parasaccharibacter apium]